METILAVDLRRFFSRLPAGLFFPWMRVSFELFLGVKLLSSKLGDCEFELLGFVSSFSLSAFSPRSPRSTLSRSLSLSALRLFFFLGRSLPRATHSLAPPSVKTTSMLLILRWMSAMKRGSMLQVGSLILAL